jgi:hypothetical protein
VSVARDATASRRPALLSAPRREVPGLLEPDKEVHPYGGHSPDAGAGDDALGTVDWAHLPIVAHYGLYGTRPWAIFDRNEVVSIGGVYVEKESARIGVHYRRVGAG